jgi:hypothetical protein
MSKRPVWLDQNEQGEANRKGTSLCRPLKAIVSHLAFPLRKKEICWRVSIGEGPDLIYMLKG